MEQIMEYVPNMYATFWALVPPLVAIILALVTKEVYSSLFIGIVIGGLFYGNIFQQGFSFEKSVLHIFEDGLVGVLSDPYNVGILIFLVVLGIMVSMMNKAGGSAAFGQWAGRHIKTRIGAQLSAVLLGMLIFIDDYFNCLTVGSVMRPVTDKHQVSRAKLAYIIDATAAPICIIAPISSWAAAVTGFVEGEDGFAVFMNAIPYNYYALLTIIAMLTMVLFKIDFGAMAVHEANAAKGDLYTTPERPYANSAPDTVKGRGTVLDLVFPIITLIICCIIGMIYTGGFFSGTGFVEAFSGSDASVGLMLGSFFALVITIVFYALRKVLTFTESCGCLPEGFKAMVPAILILTFAWTLKGMTDSLGAKEYVAGLVGGIYCRRISCICNGYVMGNIWYFNPNCCQHIFRNESYNDDYFYFCLHGRGSVRRPLFTDFRYNDYGIGRGTVQPYQSRIHPAAICFGGGGCFVHYIHYCRLCAESGSAVNHWYCAYGWHAFWHQVSDEEYRCAG